MVLSAGAFSVRDRRLVREVTSAFAKVGRILLPRFRSTKTQARCCVGFQESQGYTMASAYGLVNDVLIALSARSVGAVVITQNERDFEAIQAIRSFKLSVVG